MLKPKPERMFTTLASAFHTAGVTAHFKALQVTSCVQSRKDEALADVTYGINTNSMR